MEEEDFDFDALLDAEEEHRALAGANGGRNGGGGAWDQGMYDGPEEGEDAVMDVGAASSAGAGAQRTPQGPGAALGASGTSPVSGAGVAPRTPASTSDDYFREMLR
jgi:hypothetical protein